MQHSTQSQLALPFLHVLAQAGPTGMRPREAIAALADAVHLDAAERARTTVCNGKAINTWARTARYVKLAAKLRGLTLDTPEGRWALTQAAADKLRRATPGLVIIVFENEHGQAIWADAEAVESRLDPASIALVLTSPPYPLVWSKAYGNKPEHAYVDWLAARAAAWKEALTDDGSLVLNLGDAYLPGRPEQSLYVERLLLKLVDELGYHFLQHCYVHNRAALPAPACWVTVKRTRLKSSVERLLWLSKTANPKADNRNCLVPYSTRMRATLPGAAPTPGRAPAATPCAQPPSAATTAVPSPPPCSASPTPPPTMRTPVPAKNMACPSTPARFNPAVPEFFIHFLTDPGDTIADVFSGSLATAHCAERLGRRWMAVEQSLSYLEGGLLRWQHHSLPPGASA